MELLRDFVCAETAYMEYARPASMDAVNCAIPRFSELSVFHHFLLIICACQMWDLILWYDLLELVSILDWGIRFNLLSVSKLLWHDNVIYWWSLNLMSHWHHGHFQHGFNQRFEWFKFEVALWCWCWVLFCSCGDSGALPLTGASSQLSSAKLQ